MSSDPSLHIERPHVGPETSSCATGGSASNEKNNHPVTTNSTCAIKLWNTLNINLQAIVIQQVGFKLLKKRSHSVQSAGIEEKAVHLCVSDKSYFTVSCIKNRRMKVQSSAGQLTVSKQAAAAAAARTSSHVSLKPTVRSCSCCNRSSSSYWTLEDPFLMYSKVQMKTKFSQCDS